MSFWEMLALVSVMATILGVFLTIYAMINNRVLKEESAHTREILARMEQGQQRLEQGQQNIQKELVESRREMAEAIKYLADIVRAEGERTRQTIRAAS